MVAAGGIAGPGSIGATLGGRRPQEVLGMRKHFPPEELARDERFVRNSIMDRAADPRVAAMPAEQARPGARRSSPERADGARGRPGR